MLNLPKYDEAWHIHDMADELAEYREARGFIATWSELADVAYTYTRAHWSGHASLPFPLPRTFLPIGLLYMIPKYTLRWHFFRRLGHQFDTDLHISEVRNPRKTAKLATIAEKYHLDPHAFEEKAAALLKRSLLIP